MKKSPLQAGSNTEFSQDGNSLLACVAGYPRIDTPKQKDDEEPLTIISIEPLVEISPDKMQASLSIHPPVPGSTSLVNEDLSQLLEKAGVIYGIHPDSQQQAQTFISELRNEFGKMVIADGKPPGISTDAEIRFEIESAPWPAGSWRMAPSTSVNAGSWSGSGQDNISPQKYL